jgi:hypothetical protein
MRETLLKLKVSTDQFFVLKNLYKELIVILIGLIVMKWKKDFHVAFDRLEQKELRLFLKSEFVGVEK